MGSGAEVAVAVLVTPSGTRSLEWLCTLIVAWILADLKDQSHFTCDVGTHGTKGSPRLIMTEVLTV